MGYAIEVEESVDGNVVTALKNLANHSRRGDIRDDFPLMPSLRVVNKMTETHYRTMFSVVVDVDTAHTSVGAIQNIIGDLEQPNSGLILIAPLVEVYGLNKENGR